MKFDVFWETLQTSSISWGILRVELNKSKANNINVDYPHILSGELDHIFTERFGLNITMEV